MMSIMAADILPELRVHLSKINSASIEKKIPVFNVDVQNAHKYMNTSIPKINAINCRILFLCNISSFKQSVVLANLHIFFIRINL